MPDLDYRLIKKSGQSQQGLSLRAKLSAYWKLEEASGTRFDSSGNGNHLTSNNGVGQAAGIIGNAASFTAASSQYLSIVSNSSLVAGSRPFTVTFWFWLNSTASSQTFVSKYDHFNNPAEEWSVDFLGSSNIVLDIYNGTSSVRVNANGGTPSANAWHFCVAGWDNANAFIAWDNQPLATLALSGPLNSSATPLLLGNQYNVGSGFLDGRLELCALWMNRVLTTAEITYLYNKGNGRAWPWT